MQGGCRSLSRQGRIAAFPGDLDGPGATISRDRPKRENLQLVEVYLAQVQLAVFIDLVNLPGFFEYHCG